MSVRLFFPISFNGSFSPLFGAHDANWMTQWGVILNQIRYFFPPFFFPSKFLSSLFLKQSVLFHSGNIFFDIECSIITVQYRLWWRTLNLIHALAFTLWILPMWNIMFIVTCRAQVHYYVYIPCRTSLDSYLMLIITTHKKKREKKGNNQIRL